MSIRVRTLDLNREDDYQNFVLSHPESLMYSDLRYRSLLHSFMQAESEYLVAFDEQDAIVGSLPLFIKQGAFGPVINSLPYYGSNGAMLAGGNRPEVMHALSVAYEQTCVKRQCAASTLITSPFLSSLAFYEANIQATHKDLRYGQLTRLPIIKDDSPEKTVMDSLHYKTRNMVRKAYKSEVVVSVESTPEALEFLIETHACNMAVLGGLKKSAEFFYKARAIYAGDSDSRLYIARINGQPVAALLLFFFKDTVEYYTPVVVKEFRSVQPLSAIIYEAMVQACKERYVWWNWGGTWKCQDGVYRFKKSWGAQEFPYYYFTNVRSRSVLSASPTELLSEYPYFYVLPFSALLPKGE